MSIVTNLKLVNLDYNLFESEIMLIRTEFL